VAARGIGQDGLAQRYAAALFELADSKRQLHQTAADLTTLRTMINESEDLQRLLRSPVLSREEQARAMRALLQRAGIGDLVSKFIGLVAENRRLFALPGMITSYLNKLAERRGEITAEVTSARPLSARHHRELTEALRRVVGGKVAIETRVDPSLIGGLVVRVGSRMVDSSIRSKLRRLQLAMKGTA
jgi:F-type H+-transporting ATPase subunit delta